jgi:glycosyltransferase involved in cell wall biosynthesis
MENPKLVCICPVKNESWIIEKFIKATSLWADHIILADQNSTDNTVELVSKFEKVTVVRNELEYNEFERTKILLQEARKIEGRKIIFALDADEIFTANLFDSPEWNTMLNAQPGTVFFFDRINITPSLDEYFRPLKMVLGFVDDGLASMDNTSKAIIHNIRIPWPQNAASIHFKDIKVFHFDYVIPERTLSKLRWYQCFEKVKFNHSDKFLLHKYPTFNKIGDFLKAKRLYPVKADWLLNYAKKGVDITSLKTPKLWWDKEVLEMIEKFGIEKFKRLDIYAVNWEKLASQNGYSDTSKFILKRSFFDKLLVKYWKQNLKK